MPITTNKSFVIDGTEPRIYKHTYISLCMMDVLEQIIERTTRLRVIKGVTVVLYLCTPWTPVTYY